MDLIYAILSIVVLFSECHGLNQFSFNQIQWTTQKRTCGYEDKVEHWQMNGTLTLEKPSKYEASVAIGLQASSFVICTINLKTCEASASESDAGVPGLGCGGIDGGEGCVCTGASVSGTDTVYNIQVKQAADARLSKKELQGSIQSCDYKVGSITETKPSQTLPFMYKSVEETFKGDNLESDADAVTIQNGGSQDVSYCANNLIEPYKVDISADGKNKQSSDAPCVNLTINARTGLKITLKYSETSDCTRSGSKVVTVNVCQDAEGMRWACHTWKRQNQCGMPGMDIQCKLTCGLCKN